MDNLHDLVMEPESTAPVRFQDCDPFGHLNNARYIDYFLNARQDHLNRHYDLRFYEPDQPARTSWVVKKNQIAYLWPARVMEEVLIRTRLIHATETELVVEGLMLDKDARQLKAVIWIEFVHVSLASGRPTRHSDDVMRLTQALVVAGAYERDGFNNRVAALRQQSRNHRP
jgi:acyl-CoA thioester hydrolase